MDHEDPFLRLDELENDEEKEAVKDQIPEDLLSEIDAALEKLTADSAEGEEVLLEAEEVLAPEPEPEPKSEVEVVVPPEPTLHIVPEPLVEEDAGLVQMQETFVEVTRHNLAPLARYMKALSSDEYYRDVLEISELIVTPLIPRTETVGLSEHAQDLIFFRSLLLLALGERDQSSTRAMREVVMEGFLKMSDRFGLQFRGYRTAVQNLIRFYRSLRASDSISESDIRRFFSVGVPSLTWVRRTKIGELVSLSGIEPKVVSEIRGLARSYRSAPRAESAQLDRGDPLTPSAIPTSAVQPSVETTNVADADVYSASNEIEVVPSAGDS